MKNKTAKTKFICLSLLAAGILTMTNAKAQQGCQLGVQWGPHLSWLMNEDDLNNENIEYLPTVRGAFALNTQYGFTRNLGIGLSGLYSFQGQRYKLSGIERFRRVEYIKVPLVFVYNHDLSENMMMIWKIGPQAGFLTHARLTDKDGNDIVSDQMNQYMDMDWGAMLSVGAGIKLTENLFLDLTARYDYSFTNAEADNTHMSIYGPVSPPVNNNGTGTTNGNGDTSERAMTNNMTAGINIGLRFLFNRYESPSMIK